MSTANLLEDTAEGKMFGTVVSVVGLGKLGSSLAASLAAEGNIVIGVDVDAAKVRAIREGKAPVAETDLAATVARGRNRLSATDSIEDAVGRSTVTFVVVNTPSDALGGYSLTFLEPAVKAIGAALAKKRAFHVVVITSTVFPGSMANAILPWLEQTSGKKAGRGFGLCYNPEFIALGSVIRDLQNPPFVLIGSNDSRSSRLLGELYGRYLKNDAPLVHMNWVNAEITKICFNAYITMRISFVNTLGRLCSAIPGANIDEVTGALSRDPRVGRGYLRGGLGYGGPCFPRDNAAYDLLANLVGAQAPLAGASDEVNAGQPSFMVSLLTEHLQAGATVAVLGLTYKPDTSIVEESQALEIVDRLISRGYKVRAHDPQGVENASRVLRDRCFFATSVSEALRGAVAVVVATPWEQFSTIPRVLARFPSVRLVIDPWRTLDEGSLPKAVKHVVFGRMESGGRFPRALGAYIAKNKNRRRSKRRNGT